MITSGAPDPARWIDPLMKYLGTDYRISLVRAAAMHGSSHQAAMVFQVGVPQQFRSIMGVTDDKEELFGTKPWTSSEKVAREEVS